MEWKTKTFLDSINSILKQFGIMINCIKKLETVKGIKNICKRYQQICKG